MNDHEQLAKLRTQIEATKESIAKIATLDDLEVRQALKDAKARANHFRKLIDDVDEMRLETARDELVDFRRNHLADLEIKLAQTISRLGAAAGAA